MGAKNTIRKTISKIYHIVNPQFKHILFIRETITDLQNRITFLESKIPADFGSVERENQIDKLFFASDIFVYRYLYLLRYIKDSSILLDVEGEYGVGADLIAKYAPVESCLCINTIDFYTRMGEIYYSSDCVQFKTESIYDLSQRFEVITVLNERRTRALTKEDLKRLHDLLEFGGVLALALDCESYLLREKKIFNEIGFQKEEQFYQNINSPELVKDKGIKAIAILYLRKNG